MSSIKPKIGTCTVCNKTDKPLMKKMCCDGYMSCYEKQRWARYNEKRKAAPVKERKPIAKQSVKMLDKLKNYRRLRDKYFEAHPVCEFPGCNSKHITLHHAKGRVGAFLTDKRWFKSLCLPHHNYVEQNPEEAQKLGLSFKRNDLAA